MLTNGGATKTRILDAAEALIMGHGLASTSIDMVIEKAAITKGAFFYHFKSKSALARALVERYADQEETLLDERLKCVERLSLDPLQQVLILIGMFLEQTDQLVEPGGGCLIASYVYQCDELDEEIRKISAQSILGWRQHLGNKFREVLAEYPPRFPVTAEHLADGFASTLEGGFVMVRVLREPKQLSQQLVHYRNYIELLFSPTQ